MAGEWWDELCWGFAVMAVWGLVRERFILGLCRQRDPNDPGRIDRLVLGIFAALYVLVLLRHAVAGLPLGPAHDSSGGDLGSLGRGRNVRLPAQAGREAALDSGTWHGPPPWSRRAWS